MNITTISIFNTVSFAALLTASYALRYRKWREPRRLLAYFSFFAVLEIIGSSYIPAGAMGSEVGWVCLGISTLVVVAIFVVDLLERRGR